MGHVKTWVLAFLVLSAAAVGPGCTFLQPSGPSGPHTLVVLHTNDTHGHPAAFDFPPAERVGGLPARATLVERVRQEHRNVLLLDAGDVNTGLMVSNLFHAEPDILGYNALGYDAMTLGNHEFDPPRSVLLDQMAKAAFPFLSANIRTSDGALLAQSHILRSFDGFRVAVFGLTTPETRGIARPTHISDLRFEDPVDTARTLVPELREQADLVIALTHLGIYPDPNRGARRLAREVPGIDLIVDGHTHTRLDAPIVVKHPAAGTRTILVQAWKWGLVLGKLELTLQNGRIQGHTFEAVPVNLDARTVPEDLELLALLQPYLDRAAAAGARVIGRAGGLFSNDRVREAETALGDLVADAMLWSAQTLSPDLALQNSGSIRAEIPPGAVTIGRIHDVLPFDNTVVVLSLRGRQVRALLDRSASLEPGHGGFLQVSRGVSVVLGPEPGPCRDIFVNGRRLEDERLYRVAVPSFLAEGGDGYQVFREAVRPYDTSRFQRDVLVDYIQHLGGEIHPVTEGRIQRRKRPAGVEGFQRISQRSRASSTTWCRGRS